MVDDFLVGSWFFFPIWSFEGIGGMGKQTSLPSFVRLGLLLVP